MLLHEESELVSDLKIEKKRMKTQTFYAQPYRFFHHKRLIIIRVTVLTTSLHLIFYLHLIFEQIRRQFPFLLLILNLKCGICFFSEKKDPDRCKTRRRRAFDC